jgi:hypothetical protein
MWYTCLSDPYIHQLSYMFSCTTHLVLMGPLIRYMVDAESDKTLDIISVTETTINTASDMFIKGTQAQ